jgi:hypothetical protein
MIAATAIPTTVPAHRPLAVEHAHALLRTSRAGHLGCGAAACEGREGWQCRV